MPVPPRRRPSDRLFQAYPPSPLPEPRRYPRRRWFGLGLVAIVVAVAGILVAPAEPGPQSPADVAEAAAATPRPPAAAPPDPPAASPKPVAAIPAAPAGPDRSVKDAPRAPSPETLTGYQWPLPNGRLTLDFGPSRWGSRLVDGELFHDGIDLATFCGDRIVAAHDGVVLAAGRRFDAWMGWRGDLGPYLARLDEKQAWSTLPIVVIIDDGNGYRSVYAHFGRISVEAGDRVEAGQLLGHEGRTGRASGCHLHYGLFSPAERASFEIAPHVVERMLVPRYQTARIDPLQVLPPRPSPTPTPPADLGSTID